MQVVPNHVQRSRAELNLINQVARIGAEQVNRVSTIVQL